MYHSVPCRPEVPTPPWCILHATTTEITCLGGSPHVGIVGRISPSLTGPRPTPSPLLPFQDPGTVPVPGRDQTNNKPDQPSASGVNAQIRAVSCCVLVPQLRATCTVYDGAYHTPLRRFITPPWTDLSHPLGRFITPPRADLSHTPGPIYHTRLGRFSMVDVISTVGIVPVPTKVGAGNISPRAFRRRTVRYWHPLGCRGIDLGKPPQGGVIYCTQYTVHVAVCSASPLAILFNYALPPQVPKRYCTV